MNKTLTFCLIAALFSCNFLNAQCLPNLNPGAICMEARILCAGEFSGYTNTLPIDPNPTGPNPLCMGAFVPNNTQWLAFIPVTTDLTISIESSNCQDGNGDCVQAGVVSACTDLYNNLVVCSGLCPDPEPIVLEMQDLIPNEIYYLFVDGFAGEVCDYKLEILNGMISSEIAINGPTQICSESVPTTYSVPLFQVDSCLTWYTDPPVPFTDNGASIDITDWQGHSKVSVCLDAQQYCSGGPNPSVVCTEVMIDSTFSITEGPFFYCPENPGYRYTDGNYYQEGIYTVIIGTGPECDTLAQIEVIAYEDVMVVIDSSTCPNDPFQFGNLTFPNGVEDSLIILGTTSDGCERRLLLTLEELGADLTLSSVADTCGFGNGSVSVDIQGDDLPYSILWSDSLGQTTPTITGVGSGIYFVTVTGASGCSAVGEITVGGAPAPLSSFVTSVSGTACFGGADGSALVAGLNGNPPYTFQWDQNAGNQTESFLLNLSAGKYFVTVTDALGCTTLDSVEISQPEEIITEVTTTPANAGQADGTATAMVQGGIAPYFLVWLVMPPQTNVPMVTDLSAGTYLLAVADANGCVDTISFDIPLNTATIDPSQPEPLFDLLPNPNAGVFTIAVDPSVGADLSVEVYDPLGRKLALETEVIAQGKLRVALEETAAGWYLVKVFEQGSGRLIGITQMVVE